MSEWFARYPNDNGEYEITFRGTYEEAKKVENLCQNIIDDKNGCLCACAGEERVFPSYKEIREPKYFAFAFRKKKGD